MCAKRGPKGTDNVVESIVGSNSPSLQRAAQPVRIVLVWPYCWANTADEKGAVGARSW